MMSPHRTMMMMMMMMMTKSVSKHTHAHGAAQVSDCSEIRTGRFDVSDQQAEPYQPKAMHSSTRRWPLRASRAVWWWGLLTRRGFLLLTTSLPGGGGRGLRPHANAHPSEAPYQQHNVRYM